MKLYWEVCCVFSAVVLIWWPIWSLRKEKRAVEVEWGRWNESWWETPVRHIGLESNGQALYKDEWRQWKAGEHQAWDIFKFYGRIQQKGKCRMFCCLRFILSLKFMFNICQFPSPFFMKKTKLRLELFYSLVLIHQSGTDSYQNKCMFIYGWCITSEENVCCLLFLKIFNLDC